MGKVFSFVDKSAIIDKKVVVIGYGSQGRSQALNLRDSGVNVRIASHKGSFHLATQDGFEIMDTVVAAEWADVMVMLAPDEHHGSIYETCIRGNLKAGGTVIFAHGLSVGFGYVNPHKEHNICLSAPKAVGPAVRSKFLAKVSVPCFVGVAQDASGSARDVVVAYSAAIAGGGLLIESSFREEAESDLFGEQVVLCGGVPVLIRKAFETLVNSGVSPEVAYFECVYELQLIIDLISEGGLVYMFSKISNAAKYGGMTVGDYIIDSTTEKKMSEVLGNIKDGSFVQKMFDECEKGFATVQSNIAKIAQHALEVVGSKLRKIIRAFEK